MTLNELSKMTYKICVGHHMNGVKWTHSSLKHYLAVMLIKENDQYIGQLSLPDGRWFCKFTKIGDYYDLYIPDTREQEQRLINSLCS